MEALIRASSAISGGNTSNSSFAPLTAKPPRPLHCSISERLPAPPWLWPLYLGVCVATLMIPPRYNVLRIGLGGAAVFSILAYTPNYDMGDVLGNFATGVFMLGFTVKWMHFMLMQLPERDFWRVPEDVDDKNAMNKGNARGGPRPDRGWWEKLRWATSLWATDRGIGWNWKVKNIEEGKPIGYSRM